MKSKLSIIFLLLPLYSSLLFSQDIKVISSDRTSLIFEFTPIADTSSIFINGEKRLTVNLFNGLYNDTAAGMPLIPNRCIPIGTPSEFGNNFQITNSVFYEIEGKIAPVPKTTKDKNGSFTSEYIINNNYNLYENPDLLELGDFALIRSIPVQKIILNPVQYNPRENKIRVYTKLTVKVSFNKDQKISDALTDDLFSGIIINYEVAKKWSVLETKLFKAASSSVLSTGVWKKFLAPIEGIYKIDKATLASAGFDPNTTDPKTVKIYNNGGRVLPEAYNKLRPEDLTENAALVNNDDGDAVFDDGEYILFYGRGIHFWEYDSVSSKISRYYHPYSSENYYWITAGGEPSKKMQIIRSSDAASGLTQNESDAYLSYEEDKLNKFGTGRLYVGDEFSLNTKSRVYTNLLEGLIEGSPIYYNYQFLSASARTSSIQIAEGNTVIRSNILIPGLGQYEHGKFSSNLSFSITYTGLLTENRSNFKITYNAPDASSFGYLDFFEIKYRRYLKAENDRIIFYSDSQSTLATYQLSNFSSTNVPVTVFDISDYSNVKFIDNIKRDMSSCNFTLQEGSIRSKYIALTTDKYLTPSNFTSAENSNLRGESAGAQLIIITPKAFKEQAARLKDYKENQSKNKLSSYIVEIDHIFNEFSGGNIDVTAIRDYIKHAFNNWQIRPQYVLLLGDGDYDYKGLTGTNVNFVIPYETINSVTDDVSWATDDYYVSLYNDRNYIDSGGNLNISLPIGRINARSVAEVTAYIDKIIDYEKSGNSDLWNTSIALIADDTIVNGASDLNFVTPSEDLDSQTIPKYFNIKKIYSATYPDQSTGYGRRKPKVNADIIQTINSGALIVNFFGHGSPTIWTDEYIFENSSSIPQLNNKHYFFLCATTCSFGLYDDPNVQSGTELLVLKPKSGSIFSVAASKSVGYFNGKVFNLIIMNNLFKVSNPVSIGKAMLASKVSGNNYDYQKFHIFGDPSLYLKSPSGTAKIDSINGIYSNTSVTIKALAPVRVSGSVLNSNGTVNSSYNGECVLTVYEGDKNISVDRFPVVQSGGLIFKGKASIQNGRFEAEFITPKDVSYDTTKQGKIVAYFYNSNVDGIGYTRNIKIGGTDTTQIDDGKGPVVEIFFNDIADGGSNLVNPDFPLFIKLKDETGLNTTGTGIGHKLEAVLNDDLNNPIDLTNYYIGDLNSGGKSGQVKYDFSNLEPGSYKIQVKAFDIFNNASVSERNFIVTEDGVISIKNLLNYPNPFSNSTMFTFQHNIAQPIDIKIKIYSVAGRLIQQIEKSGINDKFVKVDWNGRDRDGNEIGNGAYIYKLIIKSVDGSVSQSSTGKIAVVK